MCACACVPSQPDALSHSTPPMTQGSPTQACETMPGTLRKHFTLLQRPAFVGPKTSIFQCFTHIFLEKE